MRNNLILGVLTSSNVIVIESALWLCINVPAHKGISIAFSLFTSHWLAAVYCLLFSIGSCVRIHEDTTAIVD